MTADRLSQVFAALADPTRRDIVARLASGDATVGELAAPYPVTVQAVSKHLRVLQDAGLVTRGRDAQRRPVHLEAEVFDLMTKWIERYRREAESRYRKLDAVLLAVTAGDTPGSAPRVRPEQEHPVGFRDRTAGTDPAHATGDEPDHQSPTGDRSDGTGGQP